MSDHIIQLSEELIKHDLKRLIRNNAEDPPTYMNLPPSTECEFCEKLLLLSKKKANQTVDFFTLYLHNRGR